MRDDVNQAMAKNILDILKHQGRKQIELADGIGVSKQILSKMLTGGRGVSAFELKKISEYLNVPMERIMRFTESNNDLNSIDVLKKSDKAKEAENALLAAEAIADRILYQRKVLDAGIMEGEEE